MPGEEQVESAGYGRSGKAGAVPGGCACLTWDRKVPRVRRDAAFAISRAFLNAGREAGEKSEGWRIRRMVRLARLLNFAEFGFPRYRTGPSGDALLGNKLELS